MQEQLTFDFQFMQKFSIKDFIQDESNIEALQWVMAWPKWPNNKLIIFGSEKCGKSYLANLWLKSVYGYKIEHEDIISPVRDVFQKNNNFLLDDVECILGLKLINKYGGVPGFTDIQNWLFDFLNISSEKNITVLITSRRIDFENFITLKDLSSRLLAINSVKIFSPNGELLKKVFLKMSGDLGLIMKDEVVNYVLNHCERNICALEQILKSLDKISLIEKKNITVPLVKQIIKLLETV